MNDPLGLFDEEKTQGDPLGLFEAVPTKRRTNWKEDIAKSFGDVLNTLDIGVSLPASTLAGAFSGKAAQEKIFEELNKRTDTRTKKYAIPDDATQSFGGKALGVVGTLPLQLAALPFASAESGKTFIDEGESVGRAQTAVGVDAALNALGIALPGAAGASKLLRAGSGAAINAAQDTASRLALQKIAENKSTKDVFEPSLETAGLAGIVGGGVGALSKGRKPAPVLDTPEARMKAAAEARKAQAKVEESVSAKPETQLPEVFTATPEGVVYPKDANSDFYRQKAMEKMVSDLDQMVEKPVRPMGEDAQQGLPFMSSVEDIAAQRAARDPQGQMDMFVEADKRPDAFQEQLVKAAIDEPNLELLRQEQEQIKQKQIEQTFAERETELQAQKALEAQLDKEAPLDALQEKLSRNMSRGMGRSQRGAMDFGQSFDWKAKSKFIDDLLGTELRAEVPKGDDVVTAALQEGKDARGLSYTESGGSLTALKRNSAAVLGASRIAQNAQNVADLAKRQYVLPVETALRKLKKPEVVQLMNLFKEETALKQRFTTEELAGFGYDVKVLAAYNDVRKMFSESLKRENESRVLKGEKPITELEYYSSHRWQGNFRQDFRDADGKHVWSLAGKTKWDLERQRKALLKEFPDLKAEKERILRQGKDVASPAELYKHMLDILGEDDPAVARIKQWYEKVGVEDPTAAMLAQEKHFKPQTGVRGYIGDRPVNEPAGMFKRSEGKFNLEKEALDFFQEQITVSKNAFTWAEMQKAGQEIKKIVSDPALQDQQPNNVKYIKDYWKQNLGVSEAKWVAAAEDALHDWGVSPREVRKTVGDIKSAWIGQKLLASAGFVASNMIQGTAVLPHMADIMVKTGGNPISGLAAGMMGIMSVAPAHLAAVYNPDGSRVQQGRKIAMMTMPEWHAKAMKYAEDNGVISRSTYDESPIEASFSKGRRAAELVGKATIGAPETFIRSFAFMAFAEQLRNSGKYADDMEIFRLAEERTSAAMVDMRSGERPILFNKLGMAGDLAGALQTFPVNFYNQWNWAVRESMRGNVLPALTMAMVQYSVAGFMGLPFFQDIDKLVEQVKTWAAKNDPKLWNDIKDWNPKRLVMDHLGESSLYGKVSTESGYALTSRVSSPSLTEMLGSGGNVVGDIYKQGKNFAELARKPSENQFAKTVLESAPVGMQGYLETGPLRDMVSKDVAGGRQYDKRGTDKGDYTRTPEEEAKRAVGVRAQSEALKKDETWNLEKRDMESKDATLASLDAFVSAATKGDTEDATSYLRLYIELTGKPPTDKQITNRVLDMYTDKITRKVMTAKDNLAVITAIKRMNDIVNNSKAP